MRGILFLASIVCLHLAVIAQPVEPKAFTPGPGGKLFGQPDVDALLARPYLEHVPIASTGQCLWAGHAEGWAFPPQTIHYYLITGHGLGFDLEIKADGQVVLPVQATSYPSRVELSGTANGVEVKAAKWISGEDVLSLRLTLTNTKQEAAEVVLRGTLQAASVPLDQGCAAWTVENRGMTINAVASLPGFAVAQGPATAQTAISVEGESPASQAGSKGDDTKAAASGGRVLGSNFGGQPGDNAVYVFQVPEPQKDMVLSIRYARAMAGNADFLLRLPNQKRHPRILLQPTGGWGDTEREFGIVTYPVGDLAAGTYKVQLMTISANSNANIDVLYLHPKGTEVPGLHSARTDIEQTVALAPGESKTLNLFMAASTRPADAVAALDRAVQSADPLHDQITAYNSWLTENVPAFTGKEDLTRQYWHRATSILRKNLFRAGEGRLKNWGISEGRWTADWYANMISYGAGHQIREARWLRNPEFTQGIITTWCENEKPDGVFPNFIKPNEIGTGQYTDWITSTVWDAHCVHPDEALLKSWADALKRNVDGWLNVYDPDHDGLLLVDSHWWTGMEWQPSFFFFNGFDKDQQKQQLERVDLTAYVYGNARNLARILALIGDTEGAARYNATADTIRDATLKTMWDDATSFFYSVEPQTHEKALVKEVIGVYPFYFSMFDPAQGQRYVSAWSSILDPKQFWTKWPVASASMECPAYSQDTKFNGKEVGGCMWNGPTWPHANSIVLSAMAATLREYKESPLRVSDFYALLQSFTDAQFYKQDSNFPWTGEYYNGNDGEWRTDQRDYNHSTYLDILIADVAGLRPRADETIEVHPLIDPAMEAFAIDGVRYHGHDITIAWAPATDPAPTPDSLKGLRVYVDGRLAHHDPLTALPVTITPGS
ncbi:MAG: hypothetical protein IT365_14070 [Candidatus Hydrogenedentes bacterium]|nr:hypothetical protein [Candidatus Hydrogenedentota bacterium]